MKLNDGFLTHETNGEQVMIDTDTSRFAGMVRSNKTAAFIVDQLKIETTREKIIASMLKKYDADEKTITADVDKILNILLEIEAISE